MTLGIDIGVIKMIITHAAALHGLDIMAEQHRGHVLRELSGRITNPTLQVGCRFWLIALTLRL